MVFSPSTAPDITESIPAELARRINAAAVYTQSGCQFDIAIAGLPFLLAISNQRQYVRQTADFRKQQFDTSREAGEQSLDQWWTRDQASWHRGAGINFYEPGSDDGTLNRFKASAGVDVWTPGALTLLPKTASVATVTSGQTCYATGAVVADVDVYFTNENGTVNRRTDSATTAYTGTAVGPVAVAGTKILVAGATSIMSGDANGSALTDLWTGAAATPTPHWVKHRIIASVGPSLYELTLAGGAWPAAALFTHPDAGWTWTDVAETPTAILASGYGNGVSAIFKFALETDSGGSTPKLGQPFQVAEFPPGEAVHALKVYLGQYVGIGTSAGLRVGILDQSSNVQYGPLIVETTTPVRSLTARDSFIYAGVENHIDGLSGAVRVNLSESVDGGLRFAYATDAQAHVTGPVDSLTFHGSRLVLAVRGRGIYRESGTLFEDTGYVLTGAMRFATTEPKVFRRLRVRGAVENGTIAVATVDRLGFEAPTFTVASDSDTNEDIAITQPPGAQAYLSLRLTLRPDVTGTASPNLQGVQIKALPQVKRQRLIQFPLMCMDWEIDRNGVRAGYMGGAANRLFALEDIEDAQAVVVVQDFRAGESFAAQIEKVSFDSNTPPSTRGPNFGGYVTVTARRL